MVWPVQSILVISLILVIVPGSIWFYAPNKGAPVAWTFFFAASCVVHIWQCMSVHPPKTLSVQE